MIPRISAVPWQSAFLELSMPRRVQFFILSCFSTENVASFYGLSYVKLPIQESKNSTSIGLLIKTYQSNSFVLLAAGTSDYCLVYLEDGQLSVITWPSLSNGRGSLIALLLLPLFLPCPRRLKLISAIVKRI